MSVAERLKLRDEVLEAFRHAYGSYMSHAYPSDELKPLSCTGRDWKHGTRGTIDDALGGYGLTMLDSLDMHAVVGDGPAFRETVATVLRDFESGVLSFDRDVVVSVFEASIRVLGGLLSAHQIATELGPGERLGPAGWYKGELLGLAHDLGKRLLPAFDTALGIPVHRVNLRKGIPKGETLETCSAAAGTFLLEFGALSRLTGDPSFETAARRSVSALWNLRSPVGLVGGGLHGTSGVWNSGHASIGAGTDSFYEYLHKSEMLLGDRRMGLMFEEAYGAVEEHLSWQGWHVEADLNRGNEVSPLSYRVSALQAFWPAMQASAGDVEAAQSTYDLLFGLWEKYQALPDMYDVLSQRLLHYGRDSPLRPELAESTLALYQATGKKRYLRAGEDLLGALQSKNRVECGYAALGDVETGALDDRMDSFFIAETLKYLFLLFDSSLPSQQQRSIFCTPEEEEAFVDAPTATVAAKQNATVLARYSCSADAITAEISGNGAESYNATPASENLKPKEKGKGSIDPSQSEVPTATQPCRGAERIAGEEDEADAERRENAGICRIGLAGKGETCASLDDTSGTCVEKRKEGGSGAAATFIDEEPQPLSSERVSSAAPLIPQCIRWSNTVLTTEGHPLLITPLAKPYAAEQSASFPSAETGKRSSVRSGIERTTKSEYRGGARGTNSVNREMNQPTIKPGREATPAPTAAVLAESRRKLADTVASMVDNLRDIDAEVQHILTSHVQGQQQNVISEPFDPRRYYSQAVRADRFRDSPKEAELEVKCYPDGKCRFYDSGPKFLSYLKTASGGKWTRALLALCDWVNDTVFSTVDKTRLRDGEGMRYRLHATAP